MKTEEAVINSKVHHGRNIRSTRMEKNINQDVLSEKVSMSQPTVSRYETMKVIDDEILERFAKALNVPMDYLKTLEEDAPSVVFETNTVNNNADTISTSGSGYVNENNTNYNPVDKISELYERLLKEKDEKYIALERRVQLLEDRINGK